MDDSDVQRLGFKSLGEFCLLVADVDLSTPERIAAFERWRDEDGTKIGLSVLPTPSGEVKPA